MPPARLKPVTCADPEIFVRGRPGQSDKKSSDNVFYFLFFFFSPQLILQKSNGQIYHFQGSKGGPTFCRGGPTFSRGGPIAYSL